jgi:hypothetical protein
MLIVLSQDRKRSMSGSLKKKFGDLLSKCLDDSDLEYCTKGFPQRRPLKYGTGVDIIPSEAAEDEIKNKKPNIQTYQGETRKSIRPDQFARLDKIQG